MVYVGRVKLKLEERFRECGYTVPAEDLVSITGFWRIYSVRLDHICWYAYGVPGDNKWHDGHHEYDYLPGEKVYFPSDDTMTDCARYGIDIDNGDRYASWVFAKSPKNGY